MNLWRDVDAGPDVPRTVNAVVEIPKGSRNKFELDKSIGSFRFDRVLYSAMEYPGDYGLIPQTYYDDGDPLDIRRFFSDFNQLDDQNFLMLTTFISSRVDGSELSLLPSIIHYFLGIVLTVALNARQFLFGCDIEIKILRHAPSMKSDLKSLIVISNLSENDFCNPRGFRPRLDSQGDRDTNTPMFDRTVPMFKSKLGLQTTRSPLLCKHLKV
jgi:hypothetical protein